jgi:hypothetical protein
MDKRAYLIPGDDGERVTRDNTVLYWNPSCECPDTLERIDWPYDWPVTIARLVEDGFEVIS